jgi:hypothetical protein
MRTQSLLSQAEEQVRCARVLREISSDLRYENTVYREFLSERRLDVLSKTSDRLEEPPE